MCYDGMTFAGDWRKKGATIWVYSTCFAPDAGGQEQNGEGPGLNFGGGVFFFSLQKFKVGRDFARGGERKVR